MMIFFPKDTVTIIDEIREAIGRDIIINVKVSGIPCSNPEDKLDVVTNLSTNQFCPVCSGFYWLSTVSGYAIKAHITWKPAEIIRRFSVGNVIEGDCLIQVKFTKETYNNILNAETFVVDGEILTKKNIILRGVPDINRILVTLDQQD